MQAHIFSKNENKQKQRLEQSTVRRQSHTSQDPARSCPFLFWNNTVRGRQMVLKGTCTLQCVNSKTNVTNILIPVFTLTF